MKHAAEVLKLSERRVCRASGISHSSVRYEPTRVAEEDRLTSEIVRLASEYGRYGYRGITAPFKGDGWRVNHKRVERIWRAEGLKVPKRQPKRKRLWLADRNCVKLRPEHTHHVWSYDFMKERTSDVRALRIPNVIDERSRECLASVVTRKVKAHDVIQMLADLFVRRGIPEHMRSDNGPEFTARSVRKWLCRQGDKDAPGSPWENGYVVNFSGKMRYELLDRESFDTLLEAQVLTEAWRREYSEVKPHRSLGWRPPSPATGLLLVAA